MLFSNDNKEIIFGICFFYAFSSRGACKTVWTGSSWEEEKRLNSLLSGLFLAAQTENMT